MSRSPFNLAKIAGLRLPAAKEIITRIASLEGKLGAAIAATAASVANAIVARDANRKSQFDTVETIAVQGQDGQTLRIVAPANYDLEFLAGLLNGDVSRKIYKFFLGSLGSNGNAGSISLFHEPLGFVLDWQLAGSKGATPAQDSNLFLRQNFSLAGQYTVMTGSAPYWMIESLTAADVYYDMSGDGSTTSVRLFGTATFFAVYDASVSANTFQVSKDGAIKIGHSSTHTATFSAAPVFPTLAAAAVPNPPAGSYATFYNASNGDKLSKKNSTGTVTVIGAES